jgi:hypothetical protein
MMVADQFVPIDSVCIRFPELTERPVDRAQRFEPILAVNLCAELTGSNFCLNVAIDR